MFEARPQNKVSYNIYPRGINLPSHHQLSREDIGRVCDCIKAFVLKKSL
jgi:dTDP-4-amino-4,6-dideoxygalactose transaminase